MNVLTFVLHSTMKHSCLLTDLEYFDTVLEEHKVMYPDGTSYYITKDDSCMFLVVMFFVISLGRLRRTSPGRR